MQKINNIPHKDGLENAPMLSKLQDQNSSSIPDGYFDALENDIMAQINPAPSIAPKHSIGIKRVLYYAAAASVIAVLSFIAINISMDNTNDDIIVDEEVIENNEIHNVKNIADNSTIKKVENKETIEINELKKIIKQEPRQIEAIAIENNKKVELLIQKQQIPNRIPNNIDNNISEENDEAIANNINGIGGGSVNNNFQNPASTIGMSYESGQQFQNEVIASVARLAIHDGNLYLSKDTCINKAFSIEIPNDTISVVWNDGSNNKEYRFIESGIYWAEYYYKSEKICTDTIKVNIIEYPKINIANAEFCNHQSVLLNSGLNEKIYKHNWSLSKSNSSEILVEKLEPGIQDITLVVSSCCDTVVELITLNVQDCNIKIPNIITPNGDGYNDAFVITGLENYPNSSVNVFDRNGKLVYQSVNYKNDWKAENTASGNYFYSIIINDNKRTEKGGILKIMR